MEVKLDAVRKILQRPWNVWFMNQGKLEVAKQMARVSVDILGISELKWTGMGEFNSVQFSSFQSLSCVRLFATPWTVAYQAPLSRGFSRQE